jgi:hypothetical protein
MRAQLRHCAHAARGPRSGASHGGALLCLRLRARTPRRPACMLLTLTTVCMLAPARSVYQAFHLKGDPRAMCGVKDTEAALVRGGAARQLSPLTAMACHTCLWQLYACAGGRGPRSRGEPALHPGLHALSCAQPWPQPLRAAAAAPSTAPPTCFRSAPCPLSPPGQLSAPPPLCPPPPPCPGRPR